MMVQVLVFHFSTIIWKHRHFKSCAEGFTWHMCSGLDRVTWSHVRWPHMWCSQLLQKYIIPPISARALLTKDLQPNFHDTGGH